MSHTKLGGNHDPKPDRIKQMAWGFAPTFIIDAALSLGIFDLLDEKAATASEIATRTGASERGVKALLNALVGLELLTRSAEGYALTPESAAFLVSTRPEYYGGSFTHAVRQLIPHWRQLQECVRSGRPVTALNQQAEGQKYFAEFVEALFPLSYRAAQVLGEQLKVPYTSSRVTVLDVGAGSGVWGIALAHQSPHVRVHAVDWPQVLEITRQLAERHGVADRFTTAAGDLLEADFGKDHQIATLGHILHSEGPERSRKLLGRVFDSLASGGVVAISEFIVNGDRTGPPGALIFAVNMLVHTESGDTFAYEEISQWLLEAGFENPRLVDAPAPSPLILATKP